MKRIYVLTIGTLLSSAIAPLSVNGDVLKEKAGACSISKNLYKQYFLTDNAYKNLTKKQKKEKKIAYYESQNIKPLRNKLIAWTVSAGGMIIVIGSFLDAAVRAKLPEEMSRAFQTLENPFRLMREYDMLWRQSKQMEDRLASHKKADEQLWKASTSEQRKELLKIHGRLQWNVEYVSHETDRLNTALQDSNEVFAKKQESYHYETLKCLRFFGMLACITIVGLPIAIGSFKVLQNTYKAWANRYWERKAHPIEQIEKQYIIKKEYLPVKLQNILEQAFVLARFDHEKLQEVQQLGQVILNLPMKSFRICYTEKELELLLSGYPVELKAKMNAFAFRQMMMQSSATEQPSLESIRKGKRQAVYFEGAPGTGKTRFAQLTAQGLKLPFAPVSLEGASISDLVGRPMTSEDPTPGLILQALNKATVNGKTAKNTILFLDEADRVINNSKSEVLPFLLKLLDPETKSFFSPYLGVNVDISNLIIVLAGNYSIEDEALAKRLQIIRFGGFPTEYKKQVIWDSTLNKMFDSYSQNGERTISLSDLTEEDKAEINSLIEMDQDPGFRTIESVLMDYIDYKAMQKYNFNLIVRPNFEERISQSNLKHKNMLPAK